MEEKLESVVTNDELLAIPTDDALEMSSQIVRGDNVGPELKPFALGNLVISRIEEYYGAGFPASQFVLGLPEDAEEKVLEWSQKYNFVDDTGAIYMPEASWLVRTPHCNILIDPTWGNFKDRGGFFGSNLNIPWMERLEENGLKAEDIDYVVNTHLHADHCGWNTELKDGKWVPAFPNARYLIPRVEYEFWTELFKDPKNHDPIYAAGYFDSVVPVVEAGLVDLIDPGYTIDGCVSFEYAAGHTPGQMMIKFDSRGEKGIFCSDAIHAPMQVFYPNYPVIVDTDQKLANVTRVKLMEECADTGCLLITPHFPAPYFGRVIRKGDGFDFVPGL